MSGWRVLPSARSAAAEHPGREARHALRQVGLRRGAEPLQLRFDAHFVRSGKLPSDP